ncbi:MAG: PQQ-dependent sugar dehydrogenase [Rhizobacter sp.]|nr:PQQ-dependent sugar dehydrogenase [Chlorobiales bacterium]
MKKVLLLLLLTCCICEGATAQITYTDAFPNLAAFSGPVEFQTADDGTNRIFIVQQSGLIYVFPNTAAATAADRKVFLDLSDSVAFTAGQERGLLGLAFHPNFAQNKTFFVYYTDLTTGNSTRMNLARYQADPANPDAALLTSKVNVLSFVKNQSNSNHNGGKIAFGPDGYLYASIGDGGGGNDPQKNAQDTSRFFGKILRIDVDLKSGNEVTGDYAIPADNPFAGTSATRKEIYAWGVRNTWRFSFDPVTGRLWAGDVGQNAVEEIDLVQKGRNYGWRETEGNDLNTAVGATAADTVGKNIVLPVFTYQHSDGNASITGGYVYRGGLLPELSGKYIYADYVSGRVWALTYNGSAAAGNELLFKTTGGVQVSSFGVDEQSNLYFCGYNSGRIYKLTSGTAAPTGMAVAGIGGWSALKSGITGSVRAAAVAPDSSLYVAGSITAAGGIAVSNIARWTPATGWSGLGAGINGTVNALAAAPNGDVFAAGSFTSAGGVAVSNIAKWSGTSWQPVSTGVDGYVSALAMASNGDVFAAGSFTSAGGVAVSNIAKWDGAAWSTLDSGMNNEVRSLAVAPNGDLYAGGNFSAAGGTAASCIAKWNGTDWESLGSGTSGFVEAIAVIGEDVYAGGSFGFTGTTETKRIARWNTASQQWFTLAGGVDNTVSSLAVKEGELYVGGAFTVADVAGANARVRSLAKWNLSEGWSALGLDTAVGAGGTVNALAVAQNGTLYTGGNFSSAGDLITTDIAAWNLPDTVSTQTVNGNGTVSFAGTGLTIDFSDVIDSGSVTVQRFAQPATVQDGVAETDRSAYRFVITQSGLSSFSALLRFNRTGIPNSGVSDAAAAQVYRRETPGNGSFAMLPNVFDSAAPDEIRATTNAFSEFIFGISPTLSVKSPAGNATEYKLFQNYPNPFNPETTISFTMKRAEKTTLQVYDLLGRAVQNVQIDAVQGGNTYRFNASRLASGIYFYRLSAPNFKSKTMKMTILK